MAQTCASSLLTHKVELNSYGWWTMFLTGTVRLITCVTAKIMLLPIELPFLLFYGAH